MTAVISETAAGTPANGGGVGRVSRIIGPVIDVEFPIDAIPSMYNLLTLEVELAGETKTLNLEVALHIGDNMVRAISLQPTDGVVRGSAVKDTGGPITVPVGDVTLGHVFNTTGDCLNLKGDEVLEVSERWGSRWTSTASTPRPIGRSTGRRRPSTSSRARPRSSRPASRSSTCSRRTSRVARSACSAVPVSARRCSSRR